MESRNPKSQEIVDLAAGHLVGLEVSPWMRKGGVITFTGVIAFATIIYTWATIRLWKTTQDSIDLTRGSLEAVKKSTYGLTLQGIAQNHREISFRALGSEKLQRDFMSPEPQDRELDSETKLFAGVLINHLEYCFEHCRFETIPPEFKDPLLVDISNTMKSIPALRRRWKEMRAHLEPEFRKFVDQILEEKK